MEPTNLAYRSKEEKPPCVWMQAGVVHSKYCESGYQCSECRFDRVMARTAAENSRLRKKGRALKGKRSRIVLWKEKLKSLPTSKRPCTHYMKQRINFKLCTNEYQCRNCDFDQYFYDQYSVHAVVKPVNVLDVEGIKIPQGYYFHRGHTWIKIEEGSSVRVGIDDFALRLLGPLDSIEAPLMGKEVRQDCPDITLIRGERRAHALSPISGVVTSINPRLREQGGIANQDPYTEGWVMRVQSMDLREELKSLMINTETGDFIGGQVERLYQMIEEVAGPLAADGGYMGNDIYGNMPQLGWKRLTEIFLDP